MISQMTKMESLSHNVSIAQLLFLGDLRAILKAKTISIMYRNSLSISVMCYVIKYMYYDLLFLQTYWNIKVIVSDFNGLLVVCFISYTINGF